MSHLFPRAGGGGGSSNAGGFVPSPGLGHELGVMFGGIGAMLLGMALFQLWWKAMQKREEKEDAERFEEMRRKGLLAALQEKIDVGLTRDVRVRSSLGGAVEVGNVERREEVVA